MPFIFSGPDLLILGIAFILTMYAQNKVKSTYAKFRTVRSARGMTGAQVATEILRSNNIYDVEVERTSGQLSDHYDPRSKTLRLSDDIYRSDSVAALGIAAHEVGHAIQHNRGYAPLQWRHGLFPIANLGSNLAMPLFIIGLFMGTRGFGGILMDIGIWFFAGAVIFQLVTLPVEFNASSRALVQLQNGGYLGRDELGSAKRVLDAAALTYVAAAAVAVMHLIRLLILRGARD